MVFSRPSTARRAAGPCIYVPRGSRSHGCHFRQRRYARLFFWLHWWWLVVFAEPADAALGTVAQTGRDSSRIEAGRLGLETCANRQQAVHDAKAERRLFLVSPRFVLSRWLSKLASVSFTQLFLSGIGSVHLFAAWTPCAAASPEWHGLGQSVLQGSSVLLGYAAAHKDAEAHLGCAHTSKLSRLDSMRGTVCLTPWIGSKPSAKVLSCDAPGAALRPSHIRILRLPRVPGHARLG